MDAERLVSMTISIPKVYRDRLRKIVAQSNLENLDEAMSVSRLVKGIICGYLKNLAADV
jgi:hypothetical protein